MSQNFINLTIPPQVQFPRVTQSLIVRTKQRVVLGRPDSDVFGLSVNEVRTNLGCLLVREAAVDADVVVPIPDSGLCAAVGYAESSGLPLRMGLIRNHYVGRTFIQPQPSIRGFKVKVKLNTVRSIIGGQRLGPHHNHYCNACYTCQIPGRAPSELHG